MFTNRSLFSQFFFLIFHQTLLTLKKVKADILFTSRYVTSYQKHFFLILLSFFLFLFKSYLLKIHCIQSIYFTINQSFIHISRTSRTARRISYLLSSITDRQTAGQFSMSARFDDSDSARNHIRDSHFASI